MTYVNVRFRDSICCRLFILLFPCFYATLALVVGCRYKKSSVGNTARLLMYALTFACYFLHEFIFNSAYGQIIRYRSVWGSHYLISASGRIRTRYSSEQLRRGETFWFLFFSSVQLLLWTWTSVRITSLSTVISVLISTMYPVISSRTSLWDRPVSKWRQNKSAVVEQVKHRLDLKNPIFTSKHIERLA